MILGLLLLLLGVATGYAGMSVVMKCSNCNYSSAVSSGGGRAFDQLTGYCASCEKFVYLSWKRGAEKPAPSGKIWDAATGRRIDVYPCPECKKSFAPVAGDLKFCPRCGKDSFAVDPEGQTIMYD